MEETADLKSNVVKEKPKVTSRLFVPTANQKNSVFKPSEKSTEKKWTTGATVPIRTPRDQFSSTHHSTNKKLQEVSSRLYSPTSASINGRAATASGDHATRQDRSPSPSPPEARTKSVKNSTTVSTAAAVPLRTKSEASVRRPSIKSSSNSDVDDAAVHRPATASSVRAPVLSHTVAPTQNSVLKPRPSGYIPGTGVIQGSTLLKPTKAAMEGHYKKPVPSAEDVNDKYKPVGTKKSITPIVTKPVVSKPVASLNKTTKPTTPTAATNGAGQRKSLSESSAVGVLSDSKKAPVSKSGKVVADTEMNTTQSSIETIITEKIEVIQPVSVQLENISLESSQTVSSVEGANGSNVESSKLSSKQPSTEVGIVTNPTSEKNTVPLPVVKTLHVTSLPPKSPGGGLNAVPDTGFSDTAYSVVDEDVGATCTTINDEEGEETF